MKSLKQKSQYLKSEKRGFTLIEIIVSLAIFSVVAVIAIGALVRVTSANRQAQAIQSGVNSVSFILEAMSREMRVGTDYKCGYGHNLVYSLIGASNGCENITGGTTNQPDIVVSFTSTNKGKDLSGIACDLTYAYVFSNNSIYKAEQPSDCSSINNATVYPILSSYVHITNLYFGLFGGTINTPYQYFFIHLKGYVGTKIKDQSVFDVETGISQRVSAS